MMVIEIKKGALIIDNGQRKSEKKERPEKSTHYFSVAAVLYISEGESLLSTPQSR